jgi:hypothetical protein
MKKTITKIVPTDATATYKLRRREYSRITGDDRPIGHSGGDAEFSRWVSKLWKEFGSVKRRMSPTGQAAFTHWLACIPTAKNLLP